MPQRSASSAPLGALIGAVVEQVELVVAANDGHIGRPHLVDHVVVERHRVDQIAVEKDKIGLQPLQFSLHCLQRG